MAPSDLKQSTKCSDHHITTALSQPQVAQHFNDRTLPSFTFPVFLWCTKFKSGTNHGWIKFLNQDFNNSLFILLHKLCALWRKITQYYGTVIKETLPITHLFCLIGIFKKWQHCLLVFTFPSISSIDDLSSSWPLFLFSANRVYQLSTNFHPLFSLSVVICLLRSATTLNYRDPVKR